MKITGFTQEFIIEENREFDSAHASTLLELEHGNVLVAWFGGSWEKGSDVAIWISRRMDGVWEKPRAIAQVREIAMWNPVLFQKEDGTIMLFYKVGSTISEWCTWIIESRDGAETFTTPQELVLGDVGGRGPVKNKPIRLADGTVLAPASLEGNTWDSFVDISEDDCKTWERSALVPLRRSGFDIQMVDRPYDKHYIYGKGVIQPTLWQDEAGVVHMFLRTTSSRVFRSDSLDGGKTWCTAYDTGLPNNNSGLDMVKLTSGAVALVYNPRENLPNYYKGPRTPLVVSVSEDNGSTFTELKVLENQRGNYCYPAIICNDKHEIMITYTWNRERIVFCKITYEDEV